MQYTNITFKLTDGSLFSLPRRFKRHKVTLLEKLSQVKDGRSRQGLRHPLENILIIIFYGILVGCTNLVEIVELARTEKTFFRRILEMPHGIPHPTTISYALQLCDIEDLIHVYVEWREIIYGVITEKVASFDGKTMNGVHGEGIIKHILSLLSHESLTPIAQVGVDQKENEIPAAHRLFEQTPSSLLVGLTLIGDALHTQKATGEVITHHQAYYFLMVKDNQELLRQDIQYFFETHTTFQDTATSYQYGHGSTIKTTVVVSHDPDMLVYLSHWKNISTVGKIHRVGERKQRGILTPIDEVVYFIASTPDLTAQTALRIVRGHWKIENNLHRTKDMLYLEDRQTLRLGIAPQVMTFMRSMAINLFTVLKFSSISKSTRTFKYNRKTYHDFMQWAAIV